MPDATEGKVAIVLMSCARCGGEGLRVYGTIVAERPGYVVCHRCAEKEGWDFGVGADTPVSEGA